MFSLLDIGGNQITEKGCKYITKADWKKLECITLSTLSKTQAEIKSVTGAAGISVDSSSPWSNSKSPRVFAQDCPLNAR